MSAGAAASPSVTHRSVLALAWPIMLSNVSTPLLGAVDTAVVGQLPDPAYIGAVALGSLVFTFLFWAFGFLRMGTTGLTAQALGAGDEAAVLSALGRSLLIALSVGGALIALQWPVREIAFALLEGSERVETLARGYYDIRIWAAPATLANYALLGWFIGRGESRRGLMLQLLLNLCNMLLDLLFVLGLGWDVRGVAAGTLIAEYVAALAGLALALRSWRTSGARVSWAALREPAALRRALVVNADIMVRSLALILVFVGFTSQGARQGDVLLAANAVLMQFIGLAAYFLDGLAFAAEALVGRAIGAGRRRDLVDAARLSTGWAALVALLLSLAGLLGGGALIDLLTVDAGVRATARAYLPWAAWAPLAGVWAFQLDGIFIGATRSGPMRSSMLLALAVFLIAWLLLRPWGNHGLWAAFHLHYLARALTLGRHLPALLRSVPD